MPDSAHICAESRQPTACAPPAVELEAPGRPLLVRNIGQELRGEEVAALQRRAAGG